MNTDPSNLSPIFTEWHQISTKVALPVSDGNLPKITICAVTRNSEQWLDSFLNSLVALNYPQDRISIHFVDHESTDGTLAKITQFMSYQDVNFSNLNLYERPNDGYGAGNDFAIRQSLDEYVLVTNVDIEFYVESLKTAVIVAIRDEVDVASWEFRQCPYEHPKYYDPITLLCNWSSHACVLIRKAAYFEVGGYDKNIFMYGEDVELSYRFRLKGWKLKYLPNAIIKHYVDLTDRTSRPHQLSGSIAANMLLRRKYGSFLDSITGKILSFIGQLRSQDVARKQAFRDAIEIYRKKRRHFQPINRTDLNIRFQFNNFDYSRRRMGETITHVPCEDQKRPDLPFVQIITYFNPPLCQSFVGTVVSVLNQTYENIDYLIILDPEEETSEFFKKLRDVYGQKIRYATSIEVASNNVSKHPRYKCLLKSGDLLFSDHIEFLVSALDHQQLSYFAQSLAWNPGGNNTLSQTVLFQTEWFEKNNPTGNFTDVKNVLDEVILNNAQHMLSLPKTTSIIQIEA